MPPATPEVSADIISVVSQHRAKRPPNTRRSEKMAPLGVEARGKGEQILGLYGRPRIFSHPHGQPCDSATTAPVQPPDELIFGTDMSDEHDSGSILCLRENHQEDFEGKKHNPFTNKWLDNNPSNHGNRWTRTQA